MNLDALTRGLACVTITTLAVTAAPVLTPAAAGAGTLSLVASSADGAAFDVDERDAGDITVQVTDSASGAVDVDDSQDLRYFWTLTPFDTTVAPERFPATGRDVVAADVGGEFVVPMPPTTEPGEYALNTTLTPDSGGDNAVRRVLALTVAMGQAEVAFVDADPLLAPAGADTPVSGSLVLEDGTGLADRSIDLSFTRGSRGSDPRADAGFVPDPPVTALVTDLGVTTGPDGGFEVVLRDPAEDGQGTELGGEVRAGTVLTPGVGDADAASSLGVDLVSDTAPAGSTLDLDALGSARPGEALRSGLTVTAPDDTYDTDPATPGLQGDADGDPDPVVGQPFSLDLDHGFFTTGEEVLPSTPGAPAGNLVDLGTTLTGLTDSDGKASFMVSIGRDRGFDDDGLVTATVTGAAGDLTETSETAWDSSDPLNGSVEVALSPKREQPAAVNPAVSGNRTYYDVFTLDQFGNRVDDQKVALAYDGNLDDWDYSADSVNSDLDSSGDFWLVSFEAADIEVTGTWSAPNHLYTDTAGNATSGKADTTGSTIASFYDLDFNASTFQLKTSAKGVAEVGTAVTATVKVIDQLGNPVEGYRARFFRVGPDTGDGGPQLTEFTNRRGKASYTFVGTEVGKARITAEVTDGIRSESHTTLARFGDRVRARLSGDGHGRRADTLEVSAPERAAGAVVRLFRLGKGKPRGVGRATLDRSGKAEFEVRDRNGRRRTTYRAVVRSTSTTASDVSNRIRLR